MAIRLETSVASLAHHLLSETWLISPLVESFTHICWWCRICLVRRDSAVKRSIGSTTGCTITEKALVGLKAATTALTFKTLLRHYAKWALTPRSLNVKLGPRRNYHKGRAAIRHYANQTARPL